jgi:hypothetical protein
MGQRTQGLQGGGPEGWYEDSKVLKYLVTTGHI